MGSIEGHLFCGAKQLYVLYIELLHMYNNMIDIYMCVRPFLSLLLFTTFLYQMQQPSAYNTILLSYYI